MNGLEEIAIIHSIDDYEAGLFLKEYVKWVGFSYFTYVYNDDNDEFNRILEERKNHFDLIIYINDETMKYRKRFKHLAEKNINVEISVADESNLKVGNNSQCIHILKKIWENILKTVYDSLAEDTLEIMNVLSEIYCKYDLYRKLLNNTESWFQQVRNEKGEELYQHKLKIQKDQWKNALEKIEEHLHSIQDRNDLNGLEHLDYADLYCKRKINEICGLRNEVLEYDTWELLKKADSMHNSYVSDFYMAESMIAKIASQSSEYKTLSIPAMQNCTEECNVDACNSFHYYRMGKRYEKIGKIIQAEIVYQEAYNINPLNFRALYKVAVNAFRKRNYSEARMGFLRILQILQVPADSLEKYKERIKKYPALELEYICKCLVLLSDIEQHEEYVDGVFYNQCLDMVRIVVDTVNDNKFINRVYYDYPEYKELLKKRLSMNALKKKIEI